MRRIYDDKKVQKVAWEGVILFMFIIVHFLYHNGTIPGEGFSLITYINVMIITQLFLNGIIFVDKTVY